jgi:2-amino-4-hydroxy-6-hydroxymethyldihydropteridine diphosphokinase
VILIGLGANLPSRLGPPRATLSAALAHLGERGVRLIALSRFYASPAWPPSDQPGYVNAVAAVEAPLEPVPLLALLNETEAHFGRLRSIPNAARTLDLDLLDYRGMRLAEPYLTLPHPRLADRAFVLLPIRDVEPGWRHPITGASIDGLIATLPVDHGVSVLDC